MRKPSNKATENLSSKYESAQLETQSKIEKLEATIKALTKSTKTENVEKRVKSTKVAKTVKKPCLSCGKLFEEIKGFRRI